MPNIDSIFGTESLTYEQFKAKAEAAGAKVVDLSGGEYVAKGKYDSLKTERDTAITERDTIRTERDSLKAEKLAAENLKVVKAEGVADEFAEFVLSKASKDVTDTVDLAAATKAFLASNPHFKAGKQVHRVSSQGKQGGEEEEKSTNAKMNKIFRGE